MRLSPLFWINFWKNSNPFTTSHTSKEILKLKYSVNCKTSVLLLLIIVAKTKSLEHFWKMMSMYTFSWNRPILSIRVGCIGKWNMVFTNIFVVLFNVTSFKPTSYVSACIFFFIRRGSFSSTILMIFILFYFIFPSLSSLDLYFDIKIFFWWFLFLYFFFMRFLYKKGHLCVISIKTLVWLKTSPICSHRNHETLMATDILSLKQ